MTLQLQMIVVAVNNSEGKSGYLFGAVRQKKCTLELGI